MIVTGVGSTGCGHRHTGFTDDCYRTASPRRLPSSSDDRPAAHSLWEAAARASHRNRVLNLTPRIGHRTFMIRHCA